MLLRKPFTRSALQEFVLDALCGSREGTAQRP